MKNCVLIGAGMGSFENMSVEAKKTIEEAQIICGSSRIIEMLEPEQSPQNSERAAISAQLFREHDSRKITDIFERNADKKCVALFSGSAGFHSGASKLNELLCAKGWSIRFLPGTSAVQYLAARLRTDWSDWKLVSAHGTNCNIGYEVAKHEKVFFLTGGEITAHSIASFLASHGGKSVFLTVGANLSYPDEKIIRGTAEELLNISSLIENKLTCVLAERQGTLFDTCNGLIPDKEFIRNSAEEQIVPMTKSLIRAAIISMLNIDDDDIVWDIGAGTGAVSVDLARSARCVVYSIEEKKSAIALELKNREKFCTFNMEIIEGRAPQILSSLPSPDKVFIGGTEGELTRIINFIHRQNAVAKILVSAVTTEKLADCVRAAESIGLEYEVFQINIAKSQSKGSYHMMNAFSSVWLIKLKNTF